MKRKIVDVIHQRNLRDIRIISPDTSLTAAADLLRELDSEALLVLRGRNVIGILTEKDIFWALTKFRVEGFSNLKAEDVMTKEVIYVTPEYTVEDCLFIMCNNKIHHLPILDVENRWPVTMVSLKQIADVLMSDKEFEVHQLTKFITGNVNVVFSDKILRDPLRISF